MWWREKDFFFNDVDAPGASLVHTHNTRGGEGGWNERQKSRWGREGGGGLRMEELYRFLSCTVLSQIPQSRSRTTPPPNPTHVSNPIPPSTHPPFLQPSPFFAFVRCQMDWPSRRWRCSTTQTHRLTRYSAHTHTTTQTTIHWHSIFSDFFNFVLNPYFFNVLKLIKLKLSKEEISSHTIGQKKNII